MNYEDILYDENNGVATITINRPDRYNAFRGQTCMELLDAFNRAGWNKDIGVIVFTAEEAKRSKDKPCILVREETSADDIGGMYVAEGILTGRGGMTSHAAVVARGWGKPCVAGCTDIKFKSHREISFGSSEKTFRAGDTISINGTTGEVIAAALDVQPSTVETFLPLKTLMRWADERRTISIRANADTPEDAATAIRNGATGIGLVRTEHMFFSSTERVHAIREFIIAKDAQSQARALEKLEKFQYDDFRGILKAARGLPVTMRLIDPPLHEFLPSDKQLREGGAHNVKIHRQICARDRKDRRGHARKEPHARISRMSFRMRSAGDDQDANACVRQSGHRSRIRGRFRRTGNHGTAREHGGRVSSSARFDLGSRARLRPRTKGGPSSRASRRHD